MIEPEFVRKLVEKLANRVADRLAIFGWVRDHVYDTVMKAAEDVYEEERVHKTLLWSLRPAFAYRFVVLPGIRRD